MYNQVISAAICGLKAHKVTVEADVRDGMPMFSMVGFLSSEVREAQDRVRTALRNNGIVLPVSRITVNLAPADLRKEGAGFDLPIAMAILGAAGILPVPKLEGILFAGELGLDGRIEPVRGIIEMTARAREFGCDACIIPAANLKEGSVLRNGKVYGAQTIRQVLDHFLLGTPLLCAEDDPDQIRQEPGKTDKLDFSQIRGQELLKRASEVAVAGGHNLLIMGPPGSGKTMTARRIISILPPLTPEEALEITRIHSIAGMLPGDVGLMTTRPFRALHHTITPAGLAGGGKNPRPGEISLAHRGVLFMDELPEFRQETLEILRQPLEDKQITISRNFGNYVFPSDFQLIASANPCKCGYYPDRRRCRCTPSDIRHYLNRISGPLLDRIDMCVEAKEMTFAEMTGMNTGDWTEEAADEAGGTGERTDEAACPMGDEEEGAADSGSGGISRQKGRGNRPEPAETSAQIRERIVGVRQIQQERFTGCSCMTNAGMGPDEIGRFCALGRDEQILMEKIYRKMRLTGRGYYKLLRVSRTLADMEGTEKISCDHIAEAVSYRMIDRKYWGDL